MSIEIDWLSLTPQIAEKLTDKLNGILQNLTTPDFLGPINIQSISFGDISPEVEIIDIRDVSRGFRITDTQHDPNPSNFSTNPTTKKEGSQFQPSLQIHVRLSYGGNMRIQFSTALILNYPSPDFMRLPLKATIVGISLDAEVILAIEGDRSKFHLSLLEPQPSEELVYEDGTNDGIKNLSRESRILPQMFIETEVGNSDRHVIRNVGKVERFLTETIRKLIADELLYPTFQTFEWS
ncbi:hypothetical protein O181_017221 [Austropuccinia psidii MF-1]|uniref:Mitochondrial distribution and morphology protein 12 n=1 Tax=Austropuccinia psidii MF-1 TaxID=1389203 RepID=A0A9Q3GRS6_9BASI|nr:hypothetical protein [Austropuccinia psidii MF-1]